MDKIVFNYLAGFVTFVCINTPQLMIPKYIKVTLLRAENDYLLLFVGASLTCQVKLFDSCLEFIHTLFLLQFCSCVCVHDRAVAALCSVAGLAATCSGCYDSKGRSSV